MERTVVTWPTEMVQAARAVAEAGRVSLSQYVRTLVEVDLRTRPRMQLNPEPLRAVRDRSNVTAVKALRGRTREDRLRTWLAQGGSLLEFEEMYPKHG